MKPVLIVLTAFLVFTITPAPAQQNKFSDLKVRIDSLNKNLNVEFIAPGQIENVLVLLSDEKGNTIFLENKHRFTGQYSRSIDLSELPPKLILRINNDDELVVRSISQR